MRRNARATPGLRVRLDGPDGNKTGIGASIRLKFDYGYGPARELHAGGGYLSQDSSVAVLAAPATPKEIEVRWPGGKTTRAIVPSNCAEISVTTAGSIQKLR